MPVLSDDRDGVGGATTMTGGGTPTGGGGAGANWAWADVEASANVSAKAAAMVFTTSRTAPGSPVREGFEEQRINIIPARSAARRKNTKTLDRQNPICAQFSGSVNRSGSRAPADCWALLFRCHRPQQAANDHRAPATC
jgi:hypothetical protein